MKERMLKFADYIDKFIAIVLSVYFISTLFYKNAQVFISLDALMIAMIILIVFDYCIFALDSYKENLLIGKVIRGCMWAIAVCICDKIGALILLAITVILFFFISKNKRKLFDFTFTFMCSCAVMEFISIIDILFNGEYRHITKELNNSLVIDVIFIISVIMYICTDKITAFIMKIPAVEKDSEDKYENVVCENTLKEQLIYIGVVLFGTLLALHIYSSLCIGKSFIRILISSSLIISQLVVLFLLYSKVFKHMDGTKRLIISIGAVCLPYINYKNYSLRASCIYLIMFVIMLGAFHIFKNNKIKWSVVVVITIIAIILLWMRGFYIVPILNVFGGMLLGVLIEKNTLGVIAICSFMIVCSQGITNYKFIAPIQVYDGIISECKNITDNMDVKVYYVGEDIQTTDMLNDNGISCYAASYENIDSSGIIIFDSDVEEKYILHKYIVLQDDKFIVCFNDVNLAQEYQNLGGECVRKEGEPKIDIKYNHKTEEAKFVISNMTEGYHDVAAAVFCSKKSDNVEWYNLEQSGDEVLEGILDLSEYKEGDQITIHVYGTFEEEENGFISGIDYSIPTE